MSEYKEIFTGSQDELKFWDEKEEIEGTYVEKKEGVGKHKSNLYILEEIGGDTRTGVWGSTVKDSKFAQIPLGHMVRIEPPVVKEGQSGRTYKDYRIQSRVGN